MAFERDAIAKLELVNSEFAKFHLARAEYEDYGYKIEEDSKDD